MLIGIGSLVNGGGSSCLARLKAIFQSHNNDIGRGNLPFNDLVAIGHGGVRRLVCDAGATKLAKMVLSRDGVVL